MSKLFDAAVKLALHEEISWRWNIAAVFGCNPSEAQVVRELATALKSLDRKALLALS
jgi:hypothetical protein